MAVSRKIGVGTFEVSARAVELVNEVLNTGRISYGPMCKRFEELIAETHGSRFGVLSNSGTSALHVALQSLKEMYQWPDGSKVIVPSVTFVATVNVVLHNNLEPVLVDVDPLTYNMDHLELSLALRNTENVVCVIPVHLFGQMAEMEKISSVVKVHNRVRGKTVFSEYDQGDVTITTPGAVRIIEDSCECMFATDSNGRTPGHYGDVACFSTYVAHLISTGVGGISITNNPLTAAAMRSLVNHGRDGIYISIDDDQGIENLKEVVSKRFKFDTIGHSFRITEMEAALGLAQMETWRAMIQKRQHNANLLTGMLSDLSKSMQLPTTPEGYSHSYMMYPIVLRNGDGKGQPPDKGPLVMHLENNGIETRDMLPLVNQPAYRGMWDPDDYPIAQWIEKSGFYVGIHQGLMDDDVRYISDVIHDFFGKGPSK